MFDLRPTFAPAVHGGDATDGVIDFSTGVSPLPPPPSILAALRTADVTRYPHPTALPLREKIAHRHHVHVDQIVTGAGSVELIWALGRAFRGRIGWVRPGFAEYQQAARAAGNESLAVDDLRDPRLAETSLTFVARPSNPLMTVTALESPAPFVVVDEAYQPLCDDVAPAQNLAVLRSLTKIFALPGLRLGYLIAPREVADAVRASLPPWNVSQPAIAAGLAALDEPEQPIRTAITILRTRFLARLKLPIVTARGTFIVADVGDASTFTARMLTRGIRVRDCTSFGLPKFVRIGVRNEADQERLLAAL